MDPFSEILRNVKILKAISGVIVQEIRLTSFSCLIEKFRIIQPNQCAKLHEAVEDGN